MFEFKHIYLKFIILDISIMVRLPRNLIARKNLFILLFMQFENSPIESIYKLRIFCLIISISLAMTSVIPPQRYWNLNRVMWMEYRSQTQ